MSLSHANTNRQHWNTGAGSYHPSHSLGWFTFPRFATTFLIIEIMALTALPQWRVMTIAWILFGLSLPLVGWLTLRIIILNTILISPRTTPAILSNPHWDVFRFTGWGGTTMTGRHLRSETSAKSRGLVLYLHGYGSSLAYNESRIEHFANIGFDIVSMDMRGHGGCHLRHDWTLLKVVADVEALLETVVNKYQNHPQKVWIYGHSVGGYIGLRLASHPSGWWAEHLQGVILESPATSFPIVIESMNHWLLRPLRGWVRQILRSEFERIHPDLNIRYANSAFPHFGIPTVPMLVLQAEHDSRLGLDHYNLLIEHTNPNQCSAHLLPGHEHTSTKDSEIRRETLENWLNTNPKYQSQTREFA